MRMTWYSATVYQKCAQQLQSDLLTLQTTVAVPDKAEELDSNSTTTP